MQTLLGPLCAFLSSCTWAVGSSAYGRLSQEYAAPRINFSRAVIALPLFVALTMLASPRPLPLGALFSTSAGAFLFLSVIASYGLGDVLFLLSTRSLGVPGALAIASTYPLFATLSGVALRGESLSPARGLGVVLMVAGTMGVILAPTLKRKKMKPEATSVFSARDRGAGVVLALLTSFCWALNLYAVSGAVGVVGDTAVVSAGRMAASMLLGPLIGYVLAPFTGQRFASPLLPLKEFRRSAWVFALEGFGGSLLFAYGVSHSAMAVAAPLTALAPVLAVPVAWFMGTERIDAVKTTAVSLVVAGIVLLS